VRTRVPAYRIPIAVEEPEAPPARAASPVLLVIPDPDRPLVALPALRAAAQVARRHDGLRIHVMGAPIVTQGLLVQAAALRISASVTTGPVTTLGLEIPSGAFAAWVAAAGDTGANVALQAMSRRIPVLMQATSGLAPMIADRVTGVLLDETDPLADAIAAGHLARLIGHVDEHRSMGAAARARVLRLHGAGRLTDAVLDAHERLRALARRAA
jgi:hypothetical protein